MIDARLMNAVRRTPPSLAERKNSAAVQQCPEPIYTEIWISSVCSRYTFSRYSTLASAILSSLTFVHAALYAYRSLFVLLFDVHVHVHVRLCVHVHVCMCMCMCMCAYVCIDERHVSTVRTAVLETYPRFDWIIDSFGSIVGASAACSG